MLYFFLIAFIVLGLYCIVKGVRLRMRLDRGADDYDEQKKKSAGYIVGGLLIIVIGVWKFYTRAVLWGW